MYKGPNAGYYKGNTLKRGNSSDVYANINTAVALAKVHVPIKHKQLAANYVLIKKIFGSCTAAIPITNADRAVLARHGFQTLESTNIAQMNRQIEQLKAWANSGDILLSAYASELFEIRIKELKYLRVVFNSGRIKELQDGWEALEKYVEFIAR